MSKEVRYFFLKKRWALNRVTGMLIQDIDDDLDYTVVLRSIGDVEATPAHGRSLVAVHAEQADFDQINRQVDTVDLGSSLGAIKTLIRAGGSPEMTRIQTKLELLVEEGLTRNPQRTPMGDYADEMAEKAV